jgi:hypothetical protein
VPSRSLLRAFVALWWTVGLVLLAESIRTLQMALGPKPYPPLAVLAGLEAASAFLFLFPRTLRLGAAGLLLTLGFAVVAHGFLREARLDLLLYAAAVAFVAVHGRLSGAQWKHAFASPRAAFPQT